jgi:DNA-binding GntR family transcriptional regulator
LDIQGAWTVCVEPKQQGLPFIRFMDLTSYLSEFPRQSPTAVEMVCRVLRQAILDGAIKGDSMLRQEELAKQFGVSRVPVREALLKLEGEGLVETHPRRGVVVTTLSTEDFEEILEMRFSLESLALELAAPHFRPEDTREALEILATAEEGMHRPGEPDLHKGFESRWGDLNWSFHRRLYGPANRPRLLATIENLHQLFARHIRMRLARIDSATEPARGSAQGRIEEELREWETVLEEHRQIVLACDRHDAEAAKALLKRHISDHGAGLVRRLRETAKPTL